LHVSEEHNVYPFIVGGAATHNAVLYGVLRRLAAVVPPFNAMVMEPNEKTALAAEAAMTAAVDADVARLQGLPECHAATVLAALPDMSRTIQQVLHFATSKTVFPDGGGAWTDGVIETSAALGAAFAGLATEHMTGLTADYSAEKLNLAVAFAVKSAEYTGKEHAGLAAVKLAANTTRTPIVPDDMAVEDTLARFMGDVAA
jgi:hypothetical protein